jgi:hypothetical protein
VNGDDNARLRCQFFGNVNVHRDIAGIVAEIGDLLEGSCSGQDGSRAGRKGIEKNGEEEGERRHFGLLFTQRLLACGRPGKGLRRLLSPMLR